MLMYSFLSSFSQYRIEEMNVSWCDFNNLHVQAIANNIPSSITQLNISGYRQNLIMEGEESIEFGFCVTFFFFQRSLIHFCISDVKAIVKRCPNLTTLDLR